MTDILKLNPGQIVNLPDGDILVIRRNRNGNPDDLITIDHEAYFEIIEHRPRPLESGDSVKHKVIGLRGKIIHIHKDQSWVEWETDADSDIAKTSSLERIP